MGKLNQSWSGESTELTPEQKRNFWNSIKTLVVVGVFTLSACSNPEEHTLVVKVINPNSHNNFVEIKVSPEIWKQYQELLEQPGDDTVTFFQRHFIEESWVLSPSWVVWTSWDDVPKDGTILPYTDQQVEGALKAVIDPEKTIDPKESKN